MQDPNTPWKNKRKINICLSFEQNEERTDCTCDIAIDMKLAAVKLVSTKFYTEKDLDTGQIFAQEYGPGIKGQMSFEDLGQGTEKQHILMDRLLTRKPGRLRMTALWISGPQSRHKKEKNGGL